MPDFIPIADEDFDTLFATLAGYVNSGGAGTFGLPAALTAAFAQQADTFAAALAAHQAAARAAQAATAAKNSVRAASERLVRQANAVAQANPAVTDAQRAAAGLPVRKARRRSLPAPETAPVVQRVDHEPLFQRLWFADQAHPGSHAKPAGVGSCEIRLALVPPGGPAPTDPNAMPGLGVATSAPFSHQFKAVDAGSTAWYALRWLSPTGRPGPWGALAAVIVT